MKKPLIHSAVLLFPWTLIVISSQNSNSDKGTFQREPSPETGNPLRTVKTPISSRHPLSWMAGKNFVDIQTPH